MKTSRRDFLIGSLGLTLGGCTSLNKTFKSSESLFREPSHRRPTSINSLGYRLSSPIEKLKSHYSTVIVGSGYGASVIAARLASANADLCILERGKEWHPGDFPDTPTDLGETFRTPLSPLGLIDIANGQDIDIVSANGLGGTSLINAAIAIRPEFNVFDLSVWPEALRADAKSGRLEKFYEIAESVLQPTQLAQIRFPKSQLHQKDAQALHRHWNELSLNIRNSEYGGLRENDFGYPQAPCVQCGNCCSGCNFGAKNTLLTNYLYMAYKKGAQIFTRVEVESLEKTATGYALNIKIIQGPGSVTKKQITADQIFLGAGAKGSTQILMRSQKGDLSFSSALGTKLSANGDVMGLSYNTNRKTNVIASSRSQLKDGQGQNGLIIASYADYRNPSLEGDVMSQFLLLDGVVPSALAPTVAKALATYALLNQKSLYGQLSSDERKQKLNRIMKDQLALTTSEEGALNHSMLYFACGHDSSGGRFIYNKNFDSFDYVWKDVVKEPTFARIESVMKQFSEKNGGNFIPNPRATVFGENIQATHPLGGCPMGEDVKSGVVDHLGRVFDKKGGYHAGLHVVDASIIPHSLSATPLLTITALAERIAEKLNI